ncbi:hypothetical protein H0H81_002140 [Sphagnurus paluster]|uniref:COP9 signalosome complex subunit 3 N-terminal helical repeats domain-containing protein n=1 Tax=Sphagnurus paluster TaxID=117069 RepID=A0A9P7GMP1_9AGAR|nr:hypothetical protein H0H81_002140 [Sphagnurus paluster]
MAPNPTESLDSILQQITTSNNAAALNHTLRNALPKESRDTILASVLGSGQDPLCVLDVRQNTLGVLYILAARVTTPNATPPPWSLILQFCQCFIPSHARLAPDRVTALARGIVTFANSMGSPKSAIPPLSNLVQRFPPDASYLTPLHPILALACTSTSTPDALLPHLATPITTIDLSLTPELTYTDNLVFHYLAGIALASLGRYGEAEEMFDIVVGAPGIVPSALQVEAAKKLWLVGLIGRGVVPAFPKYTNSFIPRLLKTTPYSAFVAAYPHKRELLSDIIQREATLFATEKNTGLLQRALARAPRWALKKLTATYVTLGLADIGRAVGIESEDAVRSLVLSMIETDDIAAQISADGTVTFMDVAPKFTQAQVEEVLAQVQDQTAALRDLEREVGRSKEFLSKAVKSREEAHWLGPSDEDAFSLNAAGVWAEDAIFS